MSARHGAETPARARFEADYSPLDAGAPGLGSIALLPWDAEIFGFPIPAAPRFIAPEHFAG